MRGGTPLLVESERSLSRYLYRSPASVILKPRINIGRQQDLQQPCPQSSCPLRTFEKECLLRCHDNPSGARGKTILSVVSQSVNPITVIQSYPLPQRLPWCGSRSRPVSYTPQLPLRTLGEVPSSPDERMDREKRLDRHASKDLLMLNIARWDYNQWRALLFCKHDRQARHEGNLRTKYD